MRDGPSLMVVTGHKQSSDTTAVKSNLVFVRVLSPGQNVTLHLTVNIRDIYG